MKRHVSMKIQRKYFLAFQATALVLTAVTVIIYQSRATPNVLDQDDTAFFQTSRKLSNLGDREFALATAALNKKKLDLALRFSQHAEKAYRSAMDYRKFREVKELSETLQSTINAESKAKLLQMAVSVVKAKRMKSHAMASESLQARLADEAKMQLVLTKANQVFTGLFFD